MTYARTNLNAFWLALLCEQDATFSIIAFVLSLDAGKVLNVLLIAMSLRQRSTYAQRLKTLTRARTENFFKGGCTGFGPTPFQW